MSLDNHSYLRRLSQVNQILPLLVAFGLHSESVSIRPMLCKSRPASPAAPLPSYLDKVLSNIRAVLPDALIIEMARHDSIKARLVRVFRCGFLDKVANRISGCHQSHMILEARASGSGPGAHIIPYSCNQRSCPACSRRRSHDLFNRILAQVGPRIQHQPDEYSLRWITFTMRSPTWGALAPALDDLQAAWVRMRRHDHPLWADNVDGYLFNTEITCNRSSQTWHPHIHVLFTGSFIPQRRLDSHWRRFLARRDRAGHAQIGAAYVRAPNGTHRTPSDGAWSTADVVGCLREVTKYTLKPFETDGVPHACILELHHALKNRRLLGAGGLLATSPAAPAPSWRNLGGLGHMLDDDQSHFWTSARFAADVNAAAFRDAFQWVRLVRSYSHFWHLQTGPPKGPSHATDH